MREENRPAKKRVLNVGGNNKAIAIPDYYEDFEHLILDIDPAAKPDVLMDARNLSEHDPGSFDAVYCSHNLEHYHAHDVPGILSGFRHVLKPGGFAEIRVPDMMGMFRYVVEKGLDLDDVLYTTAGGVPIKVLDVVYGWGDQIARSGVDFYAHKTGFTQATLRKALNAAGFGVTVFRPGRLFEVFALAFPHYPSDEAQALLSLKLGPAPNPTEPAG